MKRKTNGHYGSVFMGSRSGKTIARREAARREATIDGVARRCERHGRVPVLNQEADGAECGACIGEELLFLDQLLSQHHERLYAMMDVVALYMTQSTVFKEILSRAAQRLDWLDPDHVAGVRFLEEASLIFKAHLDKTLQGREGGVTK